MPKLHLKRTPEEEAARQVRKQKRKEEKRKRKYGADLDNSSKKRARTDDDNPRQWASSDEEPGASYDFEPGPSSGTVPKPSVKPDYDQIRAELEEQRFREKMFEAFEDDERLDALEARLNDFAHVPGRWRAGGGGKAAKSVFEDTGVDEFLRMDPRHMDDEEYAEWIRLGMYRKTHAEEYAEQQQKKAIKAERRAEKKARLIETQRLEKLAEEERQQKKLQREIRRQQYLREDYDARWKELLVGRANDHSGPQELRFHDIPWPILAAQRQKPDKPGTTTGPTVVSLEQFTKEAIMDFLIPPATSTSPTLQDMEKKARKDKLRETFLRFHPDKFEGRFMQLVRESEREAVREAIGQVARCLNALMSEGT